MEIIAAVVKNRPHSFQYIRNATGLTMTDQQFRAMAQSDLERFKLVRFLKRDDEGAQIRPGKPGVGLRQRRDA
jgi:hypothetical protein